MAEIMRVGREFFHLPSEEKMRYFSADHKCLMRYGTSFNIKEDKVLNWRDFIRYSCKPLEEMMPLLPDKPTDFRKASFEFTTEIEKLSKTLLALISESLGLSTEYINEFFGDHSQLMTCNFYPACPKPDLALGLVGHSDPGGVSLLMQDDVGGLQVLYEDRWVSVKPIPNSLVINLGDATQILTNGKYKSAIHRVVANSNSERMSIVTAYGPSMDTFITPIPQLLGSSTPPIYKGCLYGKFIDTLQGTALNKKSVLDSLTLTNL
jgi:isopenicillin N synthase-like dioxygenase